MNNKPLKMPLIKIILCGLNFDCIFKMNKGHMILRSALKKKKQLKVPGITIECKSGRFIAFYEHRTDIIANGENEKDAKKNLKHMYEIVIKHELEELENTSPHIPKDYHTKHFTETLTCF